MDTGKDSSSGYDYEIVKKEVNSVLEDTGLLLRVRNAVIRDYYNNRKRWEKPISQIDEITDEFLLEIKGFERSDLTKLRKSRQEQKEFESKYPDRAKTRKEEEARRQEASRVLDPLMRFGLDGQVRNLLIRTYLKEGGNWEKPISQIDEIPDEFLSKIINMGEKRVTNLREARRKQKEQES